MEILLTIYNEKILGDKVKRFYTENYRQFKKKYPNRPYTKKQLTTNIINALSIKGCTITEEHIHGSIIKQWMENGWKEFKRSHWFYAIKIIRKMDGNVVGVIMDAMHESQHHNDTMQTRPYDESVKRNKIVLTENQLRNIIKESIKKILSI